jgi:hypothetical protein
MRKILSPGAKTADFRGFSGDNRVTGVILCNPFVTCGGARPERRRRPTVGLDVRSSPLSKAASFSPRHRKQTMKNPALITLAAAAALGGCTT